MITLKKSLAACGLTAGICLSSTVVDAATVISTFTLPEGNTILRVTGAKAIATRGGAAVAETRTIYFFAPDFNDSQPNFHDYTGANWPYVYVDGSLDIGRGITADITTANDTVGEFVLIEGNPIYQFINDRSATDSNGNFGPWNYIQPDGTPTQIREGQTTPEPLSLVGTLAGVALGTLSKKRGVS